MGFPNEHDPMIEYRFRFVGEQTCKDERKNMYESDDLYSAEVELFNPVTKQIETRTITKWSYPVTHGDVVEYINNIIKIKEQADEFDRKIERKDVLLSRYKSGWNFITFMELYELVGLLLDPDVRRYT